MDGAGTFGGGYDIAMEWGTERGPRGRRHPDILSFREAGMDNWRASRLMAPAASLRPMSQERAPVTSTPACTGATGIAMRGCATPVTATPTAWLRLWLVRERAVRWAWLYLRGENAAVADALSRSSA